LPVCIFIEERKMSDSDLEDFLANIKRLRHEIGDSPEKARLLLQEEGVLDEQGELTEFYR
jgi:hypothetical protein